MELNYKKVDNIDEKVKEANMPYIQWKVLFLVGENTNAEDISSLIEEDLSTVQEVLTSLESKALIEKVDESKSEVETEMQLEDASSPSIGDELLVEEEEVISQVDGNLDTLALEPEEDIPTEEEKIVAETEEVESDLNEELSLEPEDEPEKDISTLDDSIPEETIASPDIPTPQESKPSDQPSETESLTLPEDEFDLRLDEPETAVAEEPETEVKVEDPVEQKPDETESSDDEIISDSTKKTVMVIDDSIVIRKMIEIALEEEDFNIITAISGKEGLEAIEKDRPNLVILDMMLPDMSGIEVLKTIKSDKNLPVIMLSGKDSPQLIETAKEVGVDDFLPKPFRDEDLVEKVKTLIEVVGNLNSAKIEKYTRYSIFSISGKLFGLEMSTVREVLPPPKITFLPNVPTHVVGVYNLRGNIISLVDIQQILDLKSNGKKDTDMVLLVESYNLLISFVVEKVLDFVEVENSKIQLPSKNIPAGMANYVHGIFETDNMGQIYLLDAERLLNSNMVFVQEN